MQKELTVVVIDDADNVGRFIQVILKKEGFNVKIALNKTDGVKLLENGDYAMALVDLYLLEENGFEIIKDAVAKYPDIPVVAISGSEKIDDAVHAIRNGAWDFITKPLNNIELFLHVFYSVMEKANLRIEKKSYHMRLEEDVYIRTKELENRNLELEMAITRLRDEIYKNLQTEVKLQKMEMNMHSKSNEAVKSTDLASMFDDAETGIWFEDCDGKVIYINKTLKIILGESETLKIDELELFFRLRKKIILTYGQPLDNTGIRKIYKFSYWNSHQNEIKIKSLLLPYYDTNGKMLGIQGMLIKATQNESALSKHWYNNFSVYEILNHLNLCLIKIRMDFRIKYISESAKSILGIENKSSRVKLNLLDYLDEQDFKYFNSSNINQLFKVDNPLVVAIHTRQKNLCLVIAKLENNDEDSDINLVFIPIPEGQIKINVMVEKYLDMFSLTAREKELATLILQGVHYDDIQKDTFISRNTLKTHVSHIYHKLDVDSKELLVKKFSDYILENSGISPVILYMLQNVF